MEVRYYRVSIKTIDTIDYFVNLSIINSTIYINV